MKELAHSKKTESLLMIHTAVLLFSLAGVISKSVILPAAVVTFARVLFSSASLFVMLKLKKESFSVSNRKDVFLFVLAGVFIALHWGSFIYSVQVSSVAIGTITFSTFPLFVTFLEPFLYKERLKLKSVVESFMMLIGVFILVPSFSAESHSAAGIIFGMLSSLTYAVLTLINRKLSKDYSGSKISFFEQGIATIILLPSLFLFNFQVGPTDILLLLVLGVLCTAFAHSIFISSLKNVRVQTAGIISGMESVYGIMLAALFLNNIPSARELIGGAIVLSVSLYSTLTSAKNS